MLDFILFIPSSIEGVSDTLWNAALHIWTSNFSQLLSLSDSDFLSETTSNTSLSTFIDQVLDAQIDYEVDGTILKYIFLVYHRLSLLETPLTHHALLTLEKLCRLVIVYHASNTIQLRAMMAAFVQRYEDVEKHLSHTVDMLLENIPAIPKAANENALVLVRLLEALLSATLDAIPFPSATLDQTLIECYQELPLTFGEMNDERTTAYLIKRGLVSLFNLYADTHFFRPLGYTSSMTDLCKLTSIEQHNDDHEDAVLEQMNDSFLKYMEESGIDTPRAAFEDAPLIMDWAIVYHIPQKLTFINETKFAGEEVRLQFLKLSMEQVQDSNANRDGFVGLLQTDQNQTTAIATEDDPELELMSKISQVMDIVPGLGEGFVEACLEANGGDAERVIMQLLDDNLPATVRDLDRSMERHHITKAVSELETEEQEQEESILKSRRNIYDNDEFDIFNRRTVDTTRVYTGKKDKANADKLLGDKSYIQSEKKNVLQRVVDMYDDDYDDTYDDINDAGMPSTIEIGDGDSALDIVRQKAALDPGIENESTLVHTFVENSEIFGRNSSARKSTQRAALRKATAMTDEQLEGWAIMFNKNVSDFVWLHCRR